LKLFFFMGYNFDLAFATSSRRRIFPAEDLGIDSTKFILCNLLYGATYTQKKNIKIFENLTMISIKYIKSIDGLKRPLTFVLLKLHSRFVLAKIY
jgi:hypothetical protein